MVALVSNEDIINWLQKYDIKKVILFYQIVLLMLQEMLNYQED